MDLDIGGIERKNPKLREEFASQVRRVL